MKKTKLWTLFGSGIAALSVLGGTSVALSSCHAPTTHKSELPSGFQLNEFRGPVSENITLEFQLPPLDGFENTNLTILYSFKYVNDVVETPLKEYKDIVLSPDNVDPATEVYLPGVVLNTGSEAQKLPIKGELTVDQYDSLLISSLNLSNITLPGNYFLSIEYFVKDPLNNEITNVSIYNWGYTILSNNLTNNNNNPGNK